MRTSCTVTLGGFFAAVLILAQTSLAAISYSGDVLPTNPATWTNSSTVYIGKTGTGIVTVDSGSGILSGTCYIGFNVGAVGTATVTGNGSTWTNSGNLILTSGRLYSSDRATVSVTGTVFTNGVVIVSGTSTLTASCMSVTGSVGINSSGTASVSGKSYVASSATVSGTGSIWSSQGGFIVGNSLATAGEPAGDEVNGFLEVTSIAADDEIATSAASGAEIKVSNGGSISCSSTATNQITGTVRIDGVGSKWTSAGTTWLDGGTLGVGNSGSVVGSDLNLANGSSVYLSGASSLTYSTNLRIGCLGTGSSFYIGSASTASGTAQVWIGYYTSTTNTKSGTATIEGLRSTWTNVGNMFIGGYGTGTFNVKDGAFMSNQGACYIDNMSVATVSGSGALWSNIGGMFVGNSQKSGTINITNGGSATITGTTYVGCATGVIGTVAISGPNSALTGTGSFFVGNNGTGVFTVSNSGSAFASDSILFGSAGAGMGSLNVNSGGAVTVLNSSFLGYSASSAGTSSVSGNASRWNAGTIYIGYNGTGIFSISDRGLVQSGDSFIGYNGGASGTATVTGTGSRWIISGALAVGRSGLGALVISQGGSVSSAGGVIGAGGSVSISGTGSSWNDTGALSIGSSDSGAFCVQRGAAISTNGVTIDAGSVALLHYSGSIWNNSGAFNVLGTLRVTSGGSISNIGSFIVGNSVGGTGSVTVTGGDSSYSTLFNSGAIIVGNSGSGTFSISNNGIVQTNGCYLGYNLGSNGNVSVESSGSQWKNSGNLYLGYFGTGSFTAESAETVTNATCYLGYHAGSFGYLSCVSGNWTSGSLFVGYSGSGSLFESNMNMSTSGASYIGYNLGSFGTVSQGNGNWSNSGDLFVGYSGTGVFTQTGGYNSIGGILLLGQNVSSRGVYNLQGGSLVIKALQAGSGEASFNMSNGSLIAAANFSSSVPLTLTSGTATINTSIYSVTLSGALSGSGGFRKSGAGTLTLSAANSYTGNTTISAGTLEFSGGIASNVASTINVQGGTAVFKTTNISNANLNVQTSTGATFQVASGTHTVGAISGTGTTKVAAGQLTASSGIAQGTLSVSYGAKVVTASTDALNMNLTTLDLGSGTSSLGTIDFRNGGAIVRNATYASILAYVKAGYNDGLWDGLGIQSTACGTNEGMAIGILTGAEYKASNVSFFGVSDIADSDIILKYNYKCDLNMDGIVDINDTFLFIGNYVPDQSITADYYGGDMNYDGVVNIDDVYIFTAEFQEEMTITAPAESVPEPSSFALLFCGVVAAGAYYSRKRAK